MKFTPSIDPKKPVFHDAASKVHVKFDSDSGAQTVVPVTVKSDAKKRPSDEADIGTGNDQAQKKQKAQNDGTRLPRKQKTKATPIDSPSKKPKLEKKDAKKPTKAKKWGKDKQVKKLTEEEIQAKVRKIREKKRGRKLAQKVVDGVKVTVPTLRINPNALNSKIPLSSIRDFILYCVTEAVSPSWATVTNRTSIKHIAVLFVSGLDIVSFGAPEHRNNVPHAIDLKTLDPKGISKTAMPFFTGCFSHMLVSKISGGSGRIFSPISELLQCPVGRNEHERQQESVKKRLEKFKDCPAEYYILSLDDMKASGYPLPTFLDSTVKLGDDWKETRPVKEPSPKKRLIAIDCEMVETAYGKALARVTLVDEDNKTLLDEYVKPSEPILDYLTKYSGITPEIMAKATCSLRRAQKHVRKFIDHDVILIGHGLENDLKALKLVHPYCADTSILYDSFKGRPFKPALRILSRNLLKRVIQHQSKIGHDSAEDARAALDLFKLKVQRGPDFGRFGKGTELVSDRLHKYNPPKSSALLEASETPNGVYAASQSLDYNHYASEDSLVENTIAAVDSHDFVFSQFDTLRPDKKEQELSVAPTVVSAEAADSYEDAAKMTRFDQYFQRMYSAFPSGTMVLVLGGVGNEPRYHELNKRYRICQGLEEPPNDEPVPAWTSTDQKRLEGLGAKARLGAVFATLKQ